MLLNKNLVGKVVVHQESKTFRIGDLRTTTWNTGS